MIIHNFDITKTIAVNFPLVYIQGETSSLAPKIVNVSVGCTIQPWPVVCKEFKVFVFIKEGINKVHISCEDEIEEINIIYTRDLNKRRIQPIYIICKNSDGSFITPYSQPNDVEEAKRKIRLNVRLIQTYFAESLYEYGFARKTFNIMEEDDEQVSVIEFHSDLDIEDTKQMNPGDLYQYFYKEFTKKLPEDPSLKYLCFMSCTRYQPSPDQATFTTNEIMNTVTGHAALGGGNMALFGTGSFHTWASSLDEVTKKFQDETMIDRKKFFDDSCGRGTHWANYSTTLGATVHELGHCFDLAHTKHGIMCRGHDDMNYFFTVVQRDSSKACSENECECQQKKQSIDPPNNTSEINDSGKYRGAHWYRSSAVLLDCHRWLNDYNCEDESNNETTVSLHPNLLGPVGNQGPCRQSDQHVFNTKKWMLSNDLNAIVGIVFYFETYLEGIQFHATKLKPLDEQNGCVGKIIESPIYGTPSESCKRLEFPISAPNEYVSSVKVRAGAWIDGVQVTTNLKSSVWIGGRGGDVSKFDIPDGTNIDMWIGSVGRYVGSLGLLLESTEKRTEMMASSVHALTFISRNPVRLIEFFDRGNGEVSFYKEFPKSSNITYVTLQTDEQKQISERSSSGSLWDLKGNRKNFEFDNDILRILTVE